jgi:hypothetical protein
MFRVLYKDEYSISAPDFWCTWSSIVYLRYPIQNFRIIDISVISQVNFGTESSPRTKIWKLSLEMSIGTPNISFCGFYCVSIAIYDSRVICCAKRTPFLEQKPLLKRNFDISDYRVCFCSKNGLLFNLESLKALVFVSFMFYLTTECISWYFQTINNDLWNSSL